jgi:hypothetical protein
VDAGNPPRVTAVKVRMKRLALVAVVAACSPYSISGGTTPAMMAFGPSRPEVGTVCVIRSSVMARAVTFVVHDNGTLVGATKGDSYFCYEAAPGEHGIVSDTFDSTDHVGRTSISVVAGQRYWLQQDHENSFGSITSKLAWLDESSARELASGTEYKVLVETPGHEQVPAAVPFAPAAQVAAVPRPMP